MQTIGAYEVMEKVGEGGMAVVYKSRQPSLDRSVAIKVLSNKLADDPESVERFNRESLIIAKLSHPNIIHVIDRGITDGSPYFVMDFVEGKTLAYLIQEGNTDRTTKLDIIMQVCKALSYAHKNGVIHRDIKPANILIDHDNNAMVSDFGIAQLFSDGDDSEPLTKEGIVMGTPAYMSPEQKLNTSQVTSATDLYSLGAVMFELFTGMKPLGRFKAPSEINPEIPEALNEIILKCLEPEPENRFGSVDEIRDQLLTILQGAHLREAQKDRAYQGISRMEEKFALLDVINETPFGSVYLIQDKGDNELMVLKKSSRKNRGLLEAKILSTTRHKHIVDIYGVSENKVFYIIVLEYMNGGSIRDTLTGILPWQRVVEIGKAISEGLQFAHQNRIIHGNLRPSNIMLAQAGEIKISDFGMEEHYPDGGKNHNWYSVPGEGKAVQGDIFSAGVILYQMLMGALPLWRAGELSPHTPFRLLPFDLQAILTKMLARQPEKRYISFNEIIPKFNDLIQSTSNKPASPVRVKKKPRSHHRSRVLWLFFATLVLGSVYFYLDSPDAFPVFLDQFKEIFQKSLEYLSTLKGSLTKK